MDTTGVDSADLAKWRKDPAFVAAEHKAAEEAKEKRDWAKKVAESDNANAKWKQKMIVKYGASSFKRAESGKVWIGMPDELCEMSLGSPNKINKNYTSTGNSVTWIYKGTAPGCIGDCPYLDYTITFVKHKAIAIVEGQ